MTVETADESPAAAEAPAGQRRRIARNTLIFSIATGLSRIAGLVREIVASSFFGTSGAFSAFTIAFQVPNLVRSLFADAALSAAFVPVFTELLERGDRRGAFRLASTLCLVIIAALGAICAVFILGAGVIMPLFTADTFDAQLNALTAGLSQVLFPIVVLLGVNGLVVGILNTYEHFTIPAIAPLVWNVVIVVVLVIAKPFFSGDDEMYAYAIGVLAGTTVQLLMALPMLPRVGFRFELAFDWRDPRIKQVFKLMLPVTISLGIINFDLLVNSALGTLVSEEAPRAIDAAFRIYMLPQGMFSVAVATVLFPTLSRFAAQRDLDGLRHTMATGIRQICLLLIPAAAVTLVLAEPITRLVYQRGAFDDSSTEMVSTALLWFSLSLPFSGVNLLLSRTFFSLQRPWLPTALALGSLVVNVLVSLALYKPYGIAGLVIGTVVSNVAMAAGQAWGVRRLLNGSLEGGATLAAVARITAAAVILGAATWFVWWGLDDALGRSLPAQIVSVGVAIATGTCFYVAAVLSWRVPEGQQIYRMVQGRLAARRASKPRKPKRVVPPPTPRGARRAAPRRGRRRPPPPRRGRRPPPGRR
ncbi:murein biosynthesis integral membrane protein MurJ [Conexibacter arvalis]|uniref:Probable lipid II flippase MurJ n=1 Tax=Conexibacter arvalis TaxID=912552 RepID=A0A840IG05_9ACTN|nr:putative peptidoglycan lipid II flippase [Conexibacter arvalis]